MDFSISSSIEHQISSITKNERKSRLFHTKNERKSRICHTKNERMSQLGPNGTGGKCGGLILSDDSATEHSVRKRSILEERGAFGKKRTEAMGDFRPCLTQRNKSSLPKRICSRLRNQSFLSKRSCSPL